MKDLKAKMEEYRANGCRLGWLFDRQGKAAHIYRADGTIEIVRGGETLELAGEDGLPGLLVVVEM